MHDKTAFKELRRVFDSLEAGSSLADSLWQPQPGETPEDLLKDQETFREAQRTLWNVKHMGSFLQTLAKDLEPVIRKRAEDLRPASYHYGLQNLPDSVLVEILAHITRDNGITMPDLSLRRRNLSKVSLRFLLLIESTSSLWSTLRSVGYSYSYDHRSLSIAEALKKSRKAPLFLQGFGADALRHVSGQLYRCHALHSYVQDTNSWMDIMDAIRGSSSPDLAGLERLQLSTFVCGDILEQVFTDLPLPNLKHFGYMGPRPSYWPTQASRILAGLTTLHYESRAEWFNEKDTEKPLQVFMKALQVAKNLKTLNLIFSSDSVKAQGTNSFDTSCFQEIEIAMPFLTVLRLETLDVPTLHTLKVVYGCYDHLPPNSGTYSLFPTRNRLDRVCILDLNVFQRSERFSREPKTVADGRERRDIGSRFDLYLCRLLRQMPLLSELKMKVPFLGRLFHFVELCPNLYSLEYEGKLMNDMDAFAEFMERARGWDGPFGRCVVWDTDYEGGFPHKLTERFKGKIGKVDMYWKDTTLDKVQRPNRRRY